MKTKIMALAAMLALAATAATEPIKFIGKASKYTDTSSSDITNPAKWGDGESELSAEVDYVIDNGQYCGFGGKGEFPGKSLTLGVIGGNSGNLGVETESDFDFGTLILNKGTLDQKVANNPVNIEAAIMVNADHSSPYAIRFNNGWDNTINLHGSIQGAGALRFTTTKQSARPNMLSRVYSDMTGFTGLIKLGPDGTEASMLYRSPVLFGDVMVGGEIVVNPCGVIGPCGKSDGFGEFSVKKLSFCDGSTVRFGVDATTGGTIRVTEKLTIPSGGKVKLDVTALPNSCLEGRLHPVLIAPAESGLDSEAFELTVLEKRLGASAAESTRRELFAKIAACSVKVEKMPDCEILYLVMDKYTCLKYDESWGLSGWETENSANWYNVADNTPLSQEVTYINYYQQMTGPTTNFVFSGKRLVISFNSWGLRIAAKEYTIPNLVMTYNGQIQSFNVEDASLYGNVRLVNPDSSGFAMTLSSARKYKVTMHSQISGSGGLRIMGSNERDGEKTDNPSATIYLKGNNPEFSGRIFVTNVENDPATNLTLRISDAQQLGGAMPKFTYNGIGFAKWSRFQADASLDLVEPTRGVYFVGGNYVNIPNASHTLTLGSQTTFAGTVVKEGAGTLALGGVLKFTSAESDEPLEGTNVLRVTQGKIRPASKTGADGLAISFAEGTGLLLKPITETDAEVLRYGLYNKKWAEPFDLTATGGKLNVSLEFPEDALEIPDRFSFGICTVAASAAAGLTDNIVLPKIKGRTCTIVPVDNGDDTVTFTANCAKRGFVFNVR